MCECCRESHTSKNEIIAVTGKGGTGKTTLVALMTRILRSKGYSVLAVDADPAVSLAYALGGNPVKTIADFRNRLIEDPDEKRRISEIPLEEIIFDEIVIPLDGISLMVMGKSEGPGCFCKINDLLRYGISSLSRKYDFTIVDCEAGVEQINRRVLDRITRLFMITDTSAKGMRTISSICEIAYDYGIHSDFRKGVILNRIRGGEIESLMEKVMDTGLDILGYIPEDQTITEFDLSDKPIPSIPEHSSCVKAVHRILLNQGLCHESHAVRLEK